MKHFIHIFTFISLFTLSCCTPEEDPLAACKADPNCEYFECLVDGEKWTPSCTPDPLFGCDPFDVQYYKETGFLAGYIQNVNQSESFGIYSYAIKNINFKYPLNKSTTIGNSSINQCGNFDIDTSKINFIQFTTIDTSKFILEGELQFDCRDTCQKEKKITNCKFRLKYRF
jgi:hypothetical protein